MYALRTFARTSVGDYFLLFCFVQDVKHQALCLMFVMDEKLVFRELIRDQVVDVLYVLHDQTFSTATLYSRLHDGMQMNLGLAVFEALFLTSFCLLPCSQLLCVLCVCVRVCAEIAAVRHKGKRGVSISFYIDIGCCGRFVMFFLLDSDFLALCVWRSFPRTFCGWTCSHRDATVGQRESLRSYPDGRLFCRSVVDLVSSLFS